MNAATPLPMPMPMPGAAVKRCRYQDQDCTITLREGLREYYDANPGLVDPQSASAEGATFFSNHDVTHVVFGTSTDLIDEGVQDLWTIFGVTITWRDYLDFVKTEEGKSVLKQIGVWGFLKATFVGFLWVMPRVWWRTRKMTRRWPWTGWERYLDVPLADIRREYGIRLLG